MKDLLVHYEAPNTQVSLFCPSQEYQACFVPEAVHQTGASKGIAEKEPQRGMTGTLKPTSNSLSFCSVKTLQSTAQQLTALCERPQLPPRPPRHHTKFL